jgi:hypothetical protein
VRTNFRSSGNLGKMMTRRRVSNGATSDWSVCQEPCFCACQVPNVSKLSPCMGDLMQSRDSKLDSVCSSLLPTVASDTFRHETMVETSNIDHLDLGFLRIFAIGSRADFCGMTSKRFRSARRAEICPNKRRRHHVAVIAGFVLSIHFDMPYVPFSTSHSVN